MEAEGKQSPQDAAKPPGKKRRGIGRKILRVLRKESPGLLILCVVIAVALSILLYNPVRTVASLTKVDEAMALLNAAKQDSTVWSVVYNLTTGQIQIAMGRDYEDIHTFQLPMKAQ